MFCDTPGVVDKCRESNAVGKILIKIIHLTKPISSKFYK